ncbi:MAG: hypothetical protein EBR82_17180 [Caulobacteraceae bacterium]|nr:hypothetical protein [Caulobacteraceae bacterium]
MACEPNAIVTRIAKLGAVEARMLANEEPHEAIAAIHARRCALLTELLADHGAQLGLDAPTIAFASEPKHK